MRESKCERLSERERRGESAARCPHIFKFIIITGGYHRIPSVRPSHPFTSPDQTVPSGPSYSLLAYPISNSLLISTNFERHVILSISMRQSEIRLVWGRVPNRGSKGK